MKYAPLRDYLLGVAPRTSELSLRMEEIEQILGAPLPISAYSYSEWWANQAYGSQAKSWQEAGFAVDSVDLIRKLVYFRRGPGNRRPSSTPKRTTPNPPKRREQPAASDLPERVLTDSGFKKVGHWELDQSGIRIVGELSDDPAVYAYVVDGEITYIGSATRSLRQRVYFYTRPAKTQRTNLRINPLVRAELEAGRAVWLLAAHPGMSEWNGLPVDLVPGLETGLIRKLKPRWNRR